MTTPGEFRTMDVWQSSEICRGKQIGDKKERGHDHRLTDRVLHLQHIHHLPVCRRH